MIQIAERFWSKVDRRSSDECWPWRASKTRSGYGRFMLGGKARRASRVAWELDNGKAVPSGACVCHRCDNPACVNPSHLWLGTLTDNARDCLIKGRHGQAAKTHCHAGHPLSGDNLRIANSGARNCKTCNRLRMRKIYAARRAAC